MTKLTWDTDEWNNATSQSNTEVDGFIFVPMTTDDFDSYSTGSFPPSPWNQVDGGTIVSGESYSGSNSFSWYLNDVNGTAAYSTGFRTHAYDEFTFKYREKSDTNAVFLYLENENLNEICYAGTNNPQVEATDNGYLSTVEGDPSPEYEEWRQFTLKLDWANNQYTAEWKDLTGNTADASKSALYFTNSSSKLRRISIWTDSSSTVYAWFDDVDAITAKSASLITQGKTT